jgi:predicted PurR-regulated permease PerM
MNPARPQARRVAPMIQPEEIPLRPIERPRATVVRSSAGVSGWAAAVLATIAAIYVLHWARAFFVPIVLAVILSFAMSPIVEWLEKLRLPRAASAGVLLTAIIAAVGALGYELGDEAADFAETLPRATRDLRETLRGVRNASSGTLDNVREAAKQLERAAETVVPATPPAKGVTRVQVVEPGLQVEDLVRDGSRGIAVFLGQVTTALFLAFFLLASGDKFRRKLLNLSGRALSRKKLTLQALDEINHGIRRYLFVQLATSVLVGVTTWLAFLWIGLHDAAIWGIAAGILNLVPYVGPVIVTAGSALVGVVQFGTIGMGLLVGATGLLITSLEGYLLTPWLTGRIGRMNSVVVFVSVVFWGWLWGAWGLVLGVPIVMMIKAVCDRVDDLAPVSELLSE